MGKRITDPNIWRVYIATFLLGLAYGVALSVIAIYLDQRGFSKSDIGSLAAWFAGGIVSLAIPAGALIRRFSAKGVVVGALFAYAAAIGIFPLLDSYYPIGVVRFIDGAASVCTWVALETILLARAGSTNKAFVTSLYAVALAMGYIAGPIVARILAAGLPLEAAFVTASVVALIGGIFLSLRLERDKGGAHLEAETQASAPTGSMKILWRIKTSCIATFAYGYFQASVVLFLPLFLVADKGIAAEQTILIPAFFAGGMVLFSNYAGRLGDRHGHLKVMRVLSIVGMWMILGFVFLDSFAMMCVAVFVAGATLAAISPVSLALQGMIVEPRDYSRGTGLYNAFYAAGMLMGPPVSSRLFEHWGGAAMLYHLAAIWVVFIVITFVFRRDDPHHRAATAALGAA